MRTLSLSPYSDVVLQSTRQERQRWANDQHSHHHLSRFHDISWPQPKHAVVVAAAAADDDDDDGDGDDVDGVMMVAIKFLEPHTFETSFIVLDFQLIWLFDQAAIMIETLVPLFFYLCWQHSRKQKIGPLLSVSEDCDNHFHQLQLRGNPFQKTISVQDTQLRNGRWLNDPWQRMEVLNRSCMTLTRMALTPGKGDIISAAIDLSSKNKCLKKNPLQPHRSSYRPFGTRTFQRPEDSNGISWDIYIYILYTYLPI